MGESRMVKIEDDSGSKEIEGQHSMLANIASEHLDTENFKICRVGMSFPFVLAILDKSDGETNHGLAVDAEERRIYYYSDRFKQVAFELATAYEKSIGDEFSVKRGWA